MFSLLIPNLDLHKLAFGDLKVLDLLSHAPAAFACSLIVN